MFFELFLFLQQINIIIAGNAAVFDFRAYEKVFNFIFRTIVHYFHNLFLTNFLLIIVIIFMIIIINFFISFNIIIYYN